MQAVPKDTVSPWQSATLVVRPQRPPTEQNGDPTQVRRRTDLGHDDVTGDFEEDIWDPVQGKDNVELVRPRIHTQLNLQSLDSCIADANLIEEIEKQDHVQYWEKLVIEFAYKALSCSILCLGPLFLQTLTGRNVNVRFDCWSHHGR